MLPQIDDIDPDTRRLVEDSLPATGRELVRLIGFEAAIALVNEYGGTEIFFPQREDGQAAALFAHLAETVGHGNAVLLGNEYARSERTYIPRCIRAMSALRRRQIIIEFDAMTKTMSGRQATNEIARRYRMSNRAIEKIVNSGV